MFWVLLRREILGHLITFRFAITVITCLLLVATTMFIRINDYEQRLASYNAARDAHRDELLATRTYSFLMPKVDRPPNPLSIFNAGMDSRLGNTLRIYYTHVPVLWDAHTHSSGNLFIDHFYRIDLVFVFQFVLSLLALLFAYDAIAGERESGTMRVTMSNPVRRGSILGAKYVGAMTCLILPLIINFIIALIWIVSTGSIVFSEADFLRIAGILLTSIIYLSAIYLIGFFISASVHRTATALMISLFVWVVLVLVYPSVSVAVLLLIWTVWVVLLPNALGSLGNRLHARPAAREFMAQARDSREDLQGRYFARIKEPPKRETPATIATALGAEYINKDAELRDRLHAGYLSAELRQIQTARSLTRISPAAIVQYAFEGLAGTGLSRHLDFISQTRQYAQQFRQFLIDTDRADPASPHAVGIPEGTSQKPVNFDAVPKFEDQHHFRSDFDAAIVDLLLLILFLLVLFVGTFLSFLRMEIG